MSSANVTQQDVVNTQLNAKIDIQNTKIDAFIEEMRDFKNEMREQNQMRAVEISEIRNSINSMGNHVRNLTIAAMVGIGAMALSGGAIAVAVIYSVFKS